MPSPKNAAVVRVIVGEVLGNHLPRRVYKGMQIVRAAPVTVLGDVGRVIGQHMLPIFENGRLLGVGLVAQFCIAVTCQAMNHH